MVHFSTHKWNLKDDQTERHGRKCGDIYREWVIGGRQIDAEDTERIDIIKGVTKDREEHTKSDNIKEMRNKKERKSWQDVNGNTSVTNGIFLLFLSKSFSCRHNCSLK